jgi:uncharacterized protein Yka (UPF0111/DUF47 family)
MHDKSIDPIEEALKFLEQFDSFEELDAYMEEMIGPGFKAVAEEMEKLALLMPPLTEQ